MKITNPITLDVARSNSYICLLGKQFDSNSRFLEVSLTNNGQALTIPAGASVVLRATRADGTGAVVSGTVADGKATVELDDYILEVAGAASLSLEISKDGEVLTTASCNLTVQKVDATGWIRVYIADASKAAGNYYITIGGTSYSFTTTQAIPAGGSVYFSSDNATAETRDAAGTVIETGLILTQGTTGTQLVSDVPTMSFLTAFVASVNSQIATQDAAIALKADKTYVDAQDALKADKTYVDTELAKKQDKDKPIALADNLTPYSSDSGTEQSIPFLNEGTGCGNGETQVDTGSYLQLQNKLGNTVCVNQLFNNYTFSAGTHTWDIAGATFSMIPGRTYLFFTDENEYDIRVRNSNEGIIGTGGKYVTFACTVASANYTIQVSGTATKPANVRCIDLSLWFGSTSAIPSHLLSHPEDFGRYYSGSLAYDAGHLENADGSVLTSIGRNVWDEVAENGRINSTTGANSSGNGLRSKNFIPAIPNTEYYAKAGSYTGAGSILICYYDASQNYISYDNKVGFSVTFTTPSNCHFIRFNIQTSAAVTYNHDITISLYYSGESGYDQYYPYTVLASVDTGSEVLRSAGEAHDVKTPDGTITRNIGTVNLGSLTWAYADIGAGVSAFYTSAISSLVNPGSNMLNLRCSKYLTTSQNGLYTGDKLIAVNTGGIVYVVDTSYTDAATFKTAMSGVYLYYELATPTTEQGTSFPSNIPCDDFGSLLWTQTNGVPQGNTIFYPVDYKASLDSLLNMVNGDVSDLATDSEVQAVADRVPDAPSTDGTYVLKVTVSSGTKTYSWISE